MNYDYFEYCVDVIATVLAINYSIKKNKILNSKLGQIIRNEVKRILNEYGKFEMKYFNFELILDENHKLRKDLLE